MTDIICQSCGKYKGLFVQVYKHGSYYDSEEGFEQEWTEELFYCIKCFKELEIDE